MGFVFVFLLLVRFIFNFISLVRGFKRYLVEMTPSNPQIGHLILECLRKNPDSICQVDAATGESETNASVLRRVIRLSKCFRQLGLKPGDILALGGRHHLDFHIPYYAALMCGLAIAIVDSLYNYEELKRMFALIKPNISFCQQESYEDTLKAVKELELDTKIVTFDGEECNMKMLMDSFDGDNDDDGDNFQLAEFDGNEILAWLVATSGTTGGVQKFASFTYNSVKKLFQLFIAVVKPTSGYTMNVSPSHWFSAYFNALGIPLFCTTMLKTSSPITARNLVDMINKYKPVRATLSPTLVALILNHPEPCDLTCFENIFITGSKIREDLITELRRRVGPETVVEELYGQTESLGHVLKCASEGPLGNCGVSVPSLYQVKLVDPETEEEITEPNKPGEMWVKTELKFTGYYKMPEETAEVLTPDGWLKTGDLLYRDENNYYFFLDRLKMLMKYKGYHIMPTELEKVIRTLEGVEEVAVTSIPEPEKCFDLPVACVVRKSGADVTADDVKHIVASTLSDNKRLRGGVVFMDTLPMTSTGKVARAKLKQLVQTARRE